jgi:hypothetical protein
MSKKLRRVLLLKVMLVGVVVVVFKEIFRIIDFVVSSLVATMGILGFIQRKSDETAVVSLCPPRAQILCPSTLRAPRDLIPFWQVRVL